MILRKTLRSHNAGCAILKSTVPHNSHEAWNGFQRKKFSCKGSIIARRGKRNLEMSSTTEFQRIKSLKKGHLCLRDKISDLEEKRQKEKRLYSKYPSISDQVSTVYNQ
ncbi:hypothetical protein TNCT_161201 [Trichonephila clavata]|uniref:Uncharacterized protein n=1 Tax=Trichonephila clavata TaxID=2740835 RepID=A0A8X6KWD4_TRICU|nr:hypothetical protein TNCT_161201 [Trichonephila clavata]